MASDYKNFTSFEPKWDDLLDRYLLEQLSAEERLMFEDRCYDDKALFEELQVRDKILKSLAKNSAELEAEYFAKKREMQTTKTARHEPSRPWWSLPRPAWNYGLAVASILTVIFASYKGYLIYDDARFWEQFEYSDNVPFEYEPRALRGAEVDSDSEEELRTFKSRFELAISDYESTDYLRGLEAMQRLATDAEVLQQRFSDESQRRMFRDYFFYHGLTNLALARSKMQLIGGPQRSHFVQEASRLLEQAQSKTNSDEHEYFNRIRFFRALAYGFSDQKERAKSLLREIAPGTTYYQKSQKLIRRWSD